MPEILLVRQKYPRKASISRWHTNGHYYDWCWTRYAVDICDLECLTGWEKHILDCSSPFSSILCHFKEETTAAGGVETGHLRLVDV
jgi:hypothetical protein